MSFWNSILDAVADRVGADIQGRTVSQKHRDHALKGESYSVESEVSEALADLMLMYSSAPVAGESPRAQWLNRQSEAFWMTKAERAVVSAFLTGDCIVVPSWNGRNVQNIVVPSTDFEVLQAFGDEITACAYVLDRKVKNNTTYTLMQALELVPYETASGVTYANRYRMFAARNGSLAGASLDDFPEWRDRFDPEWHVPNVDRLLIGRMRSTAIDPLDVNAVKGAPICFGAGEPIAEIRHLLNAMSAEFDLSEKAIMADKRLFKKEWRNGESSTVLPRGRERLFMDVRGQNELPIKEWSPEIRYQAYIEAIDKQEQLVERAVGVSPGLISNANDQNYQNVDNVRKGQQRTIGFIEKARRSFDRMMEDLVYAWDVLANYYGIDGVGDYELTCDWSTEYIETFADQQSAILAGNAIGATDAADYRVWLYGETPEAAKERVAEIKAEQRRGAAVLMPLDE